MKKNIQLMLCSLLFLDAGCSYPELTMDEIRELTKTGTGGSDGMDSGGSGSDEPVKEISIKFDKYTVYSDNNGDKIVNKGETVGLRVSLKNTGTGTTNAVEATFSSNSPSISGFTPTTAVNYATIAAGSTKTVNYDGYAGSLAESYTVKFTVSNSATAGTQIPINISIVDESGNTWADSFNAVVGSETAEMAYDKYTVVVDYDGDKKVEKGEQVYLQVLLRNIGSGAANAVKASFSSGSSYISGLSPTTQIDYGNYTGGQSKYGQGGYDFSVYYTIMFTVSNSATAGTQIPINIGMVDGSSNSWTGSFNVKVE
ncbi:hypothetical protein [Candidatus Symbiothrix dinenymphae]|uniref:hypothetical protein n=1 Tax=Candidatus Symbiothrix dinenymphae TaxID=467085 RepID=UPI000702CDFC|nr:hypothetical protein [Candidatus Symbiothrix dinenymphae]